MKKILLVEDDPYLLENIVVFLKEEGFETKVDKDGSGALKLIKAWEPDLIICDINLPVRGGYEIREEIISDPKLKRIPFIFLTAKVEKEDLRKGMRLGADDYIFKPFDLDDLLNSINLRLEKSSLTQDELNRTDGENRSTYTPDDKILVKSGSKANFYYVKDLKFIKSQSPYILLKFSEGKSTLLRQTINEWEKKLPKKTFIRIHRSTIVNTDFIQKISKVGNSSYLVTLKEESETFTISKRYSSKLKELLL